MSDDRREMAFEILRMLQCNRGNFVSNFTCISEEDVHSVGASEPRNNVIFAAGCTLENEESRANKPPLRMPAGDTPAAGAPVAPPTVAVGR